jgi:hypothetical protein
MLACVFFGGVGSACYLTSDFNGIADGKPTASDAGDEAAVLDSGAEAATPPLTCTPGQHLICSTFDNGALDGDGWSIKLSTGATATLTTSEFVTPPTSFQSIIPANTSTTTLGMALLTQKVAPKTNWTTLTFAFDFRLTACSGENGGITILALTPGTNTVFGLVFASQGLEWGQLVSFVDGGQTFVSAKLAQPKLKTWTRIQITIANPANPVVDITYDGVSVLAAHPSQAFSPTTLSAVSLGLDGSGVNTQCDVAFDNVTFDSH